ncbi:MAG TPA: hypothetical protein VFR24_03275, partial [Candidatus Angelobacter sp.]|nr:hypothetical protein [Candidatus Angelobacter sp.]
MAVHTRRLTITTIKTAYTSLVWAIGNRLTLNFLWPVVFLHRLHRDISSRNSGYIVIGKDAAFASESSAV